VGLLPGRGFVVNPTVEEMAGSTLDLVIAGTSEAVLMIEGFCDFLTEEQMLEVRGAGGGRCTAGPGPSSLRAAIINGQTKQGT
jgi:polyribonucleotide nucleotidyltransferase